MLTKDDLDAIKKIVTEDSAPLKTEVKLIKRDMRSMKKDIRQLKQDVSFISREFDSEIIDNKRRIIRI